ncbi:MAG: lysozyme [Pseudomonadota bacterium]
MRTSQSGLELIKSFEGFHRRAMPLGGGRWVIGYGHTKGARAGVGILQSDAEAVLREYDLPPIEKELQSLVHAPLTQNQFDALVSFAFNIGIDGFRNSAVLAHLNAGEHLQAADAMGAWRVAEVNGQTLLIDALVRRRAAETALFLTPHGSRITAPTAKLTPKFDEARIPLGQLKPALAPGAMPAQAPGDMQDITPVDNGDPIVSGQNGLVPTASDETTKDMKDRLVRILGEPKPPRPMAADRPDADRLSVPTPDEIAKAISVIADPVASDPAEMAASESGDVGRRKVEIDDLEPVDVDPAMVRNAMAQNTPVDAHGEVGPMSYSFYGVLAVVGLLIGGFGLADLLAALNPASAVTPGEQYAGFGLSLLGAVMLLLAVYFVAKSWISDRV